MFRYWSLTPAKYKGVIWGRERFPRLGPLTDAEGKRWNIGAVLGKFVAAVPENQLHPYYTSTSIERFGTVYQSWEPYRYFRPASFLYDFDEWFDQAVYMAEREKP